MGREFASNLDRSLNTELTLALAQRTHTRENWSYKKTTFTRIPANIRAICHRTGGRQSAVVVVGDAGESVRNATRAARAVGMQAQVCLPFPCR